MKNRGSLFAGGVVSTLLTLSIVSAETGWETLRNGASVFKAFNYIFGKIVTIPESNINIISSAIITVAVWLMLALTFGDIFRVFTSFSEGVSWALGFLIAIIAANLGWVVALAAYTTGIFAYLGTLGIFLGIGAGIFAFIVVNLGIAKFGPWIMRRKAMMTAAKSTIDTETGAKQVGAAVKGMKLIGKDLADTS